MKKLLHVGCGFKTIDQTTDYFLDPEWVETRYDIDESVSPDIVGSMLNMDKLNDDSFDVIFSSHNIEHLFATSVPVALSEFLRVPISPDSLSSLVRLQSVCKYVVSDQLVEPLYQSQIGPICALDILYDIGLLSQRETSILTGGIHRTISRHD